jgi:ABC-type molybdate transport system substrate-binding protein
MQSSKTLFFVIIGLAVLAVAAMFAFVFFFRDEVTTLSTPLQQAVEFEVLAAPDIEPWLNDAADKFSADNPNITIRVIETTDLIPTARLQTAAVWVPAAGFVAAAAGRDTGGAPSLAGSGMAWGLYNDKLETLRQSYGEPGWDTLHAKATSPDGLKLVIDSPQNTGSGLAALASAAAFSQQTSRLASADVGAANNWLTETLGNNNARALPKAAETLASVQGRSIADLGLLSGAAWRQAKLDQSAQFTLLPVEPPVTLDYPFIIISTDDNTRQAAGTFRDYLLQPQQQDALAAYGLEQAGAVTNGVQLESDAAQRLLSWADRTLR